MCGKKKSDIVKKQSESRKDKKMSKRKTHLVEAPVDSDSYSDEEAFDTSHNHVHHSGGRGRMKKLTTLLMLSYTEIQLEIDTGAELSTIPFSVYREKLSKVKLEPSTVSLRQYDGTPLSVRGEIMLNVQKGEQNLSGRFVVVDHVKDQLLLLGRDWLNRVRLDWTKFFSNMQSKVVNMDLIKEEFPDVFKKELGMLKGIEAEIELQQGVSPRFCKSRPIPFSLRSQVEQALIHKCFFCK